MTGLHQTGSTGHGPASAENDYLAVIHAFSEVAESLGANRDLDDLLHLIVVKICELVGVARGSVYLREGNQGIFRGQVGNDAERATDARVKRLKIGMAADAFTREIVETKAPVIAQNAASDPRVFQSTVRAWKVRSIMGVPMLLRGEVIGIITLDPQDRPHVFSAADRDTAAAFADLSAVAFAQAQAAAELRTSMETVARQNKVLRKVSAVEDRLTALVLDGGSIAEIARSVGELTGKPCGVYDARHRPLAVLSAPGRTDGMQPRLLDPDVRDHPQVRAALAPLDDRQAAVVGPIPAAGLHHRYLVAPVMSHHKRWGTLVLMEHGSRFGQFDSIISRRAATIVALEVMAERRAAAAEWNARAALVGELIRGTLDPDTLQRRAEFLGLRLDSPHVLCVLACRENAAAPVPEVHTVLATVAAIAPGTEALAARVTEGIVLLLPLPDGEPGDTGIGPAKTVVTGICEALDGGGHLLAGLSRPCRSVADYAGAFTQAREVVQCLEDFCAPGEPAVFAAEELGAGRLFLTGSGRVAADRFAEETLGALLAEGVPPELLTTLSVFFDEDRSIRRSADHLAVHENTIRYRLARIEELIGLPVRTDSDTQLSAQLALLVLRLRGRLRTAGPAESGDGPPPATGEAA